MSDNIFSMESMENWGWHKNVSNILPFYGIDPSSAHKLLSLSENATYLVTEPHAHNKYILRLSRPGYRSYKELWSELYWIAQIRSSLPEVKTPAFLHNVQDEMITCYRDDEGREQFAVLFEYVSGDHPEGDTLISAFHQLGEIAGHLHNSSDHLQLDKAFQRPLWNVQTILDPIDVGANWRNHAMVDTLTADVLAKVEEKIEDELQRYGMNAANWGLIHGDMRLTNQLVTPDALYLIDFDDCGFSWFLYELACSLSFIEHQENVPELATAWINAYHAVRPLNEDDLKIVPSLVMLRRLFLIAWFSTHEFHTDETINALRSCYVRDTLPMAKLYLDDMFLSTIQTNNTATCN